MTRSLLTWLLLGSLASLGCGDDDDDMGTAGSGGLGGATAGQAGQGTGGTVSAGGAGQGGSSAGAGGTVSGGSGHGGATAGTSSGAGKGGASAAGTAGAPAAGTGGTPAAGTGGAPAAGAGGAPAAGTGGTAGASGASGASTAGTGAGAGAAGAAAGAAGAAAGAGGQGSAGAASSARWLMGYYPGYQSTDLPAADVRFDLLTHLAVGAVLPEADGSLDTTFYKDATSGPAFAKDAAAKAHQAGKKAILMVGGAGAHDGFAAAAASAATRATFVSNLVAFAQQNGFDGVDLDWEPLPASEMDSIIALAQALRAAWPGAILTMPVNPINPNYEKVDAKFATLSGSLDQLNVMTYSMAGSYSGWKSWHHSPLMGQTPATPTSISTSVDAYLGAGIPAAKLGMGEGFYGLCYTSPVSAPLQDLQGSTASADDNKLDYRTLLSTYLPSATQKWDDSARSPYLVFAQPTGPLKCTYLSYTNEQSIAAHTDYVKQKGLGGSIVWTINEGHVPSKPAGERDPLLTALWNGLK